jgi:hypothetical protein
MKNDAKPAVSDTVRADVGLTPCMISRVRCIINCDLAGQDPRDLTDRQLLRYRKVGPATLEAIRLLTDPALQFCPHCGHRIEANSLLDRSDLPNTIFLSPLRIDIFGLAF